MSLLHIFRPQEMRAALLALDIERKNADGLMLSMGMDLAMPGVKKAIKKNPRLLQRKLYEEKVNLNSLLYLMLVNECGFLMQTGRYHSGFGGHLMQGDALICLWHFAADKLEQAGVWSVERSRAAREMFRQQSTTIR
jgi:hypothetical protein